jgi:uncharacterized membrane protein YuzA (DUF378 family)
MNNKTVHMAAFILLVVGGLNWLLIALFSFNLVEAVLGNWPMLVKAVYVLVGLGAIHELLTHKKNCAQCQ